MDRTKYAAVMLALQKKEEQRMQTLTMYKGKGKNALGIEDFTLKTMLGRGGFGKVQSTTGYKLILPCRLFLPRGRAHGKCAQSRL